MKRSVIVLVETNSAKGTNLVPRFILPVVILALLTTTAAMATDPATGKPAKDTSGADAWPFDPSGVWTLDESRSDNLTALQDMLRTNRRVSREGRDGGRGMGSARGGGGGGGIGDRASMGRGMGGRPGGRSAPSDGGPENRQTDTSPRDLHKAYSLLLIARLNDGIEIIDGAEQTRLWTPDGQPRTRQTARDDTTILRAWWEGSILCLEQMNNRRTVTQRLQITNDDKTLTVILEVAVLGDDTVSGTLVYRGL